VSYATTATDALVIALLLVGTWFVVRWYTCERARRSAETHRPRWLDVNIGLVTNFLDTLGIGSFAPTTAAYKLIKRMPDEEIPGTLNVGGALASIVQAVIFIPAIHVELPTLLSMITASVLGAWFGAGTVARLSRRTIQLGMGFTLAVAAALFVATNLDVLPGGGATSGTSGLSGAALAFAIGVIFLLGALNMLGVGLYAPCLILVSLLGMDPLAAFPIMMGASAFLMPIGGMRFIRLSCYNARAAIGLTVGGIPGVLIAAYLVKSLPMGGLRWLVTVVVLYAAISMLYSGFASVPQPGKNASV
jgi:uncharacterized membrane protein YfcA